MALTPAVLKRQGRAPLLGANFMKNRDLLPFIISFVSVICLSVGCVKAGPGFSIEESDGGLVVKRNGEFFTEYIVSGEGNKPYLWPVVGPTGKRMTRAYPMEDVEGEKQDHPHHRSIWFGHQEMGGSDTWHEPLTMEDRKLKPGETKEGRLAKLGSTVNDYLAGDGSPLMEDVRQLTFAESGGAVVLDFDIELTAVKDISLGEAKDAGLSVRVAHSMCVDAGEGGKIVNSHGNEDTDAWGKRAPWVTFYGPVEGEVLGVTMMNHPSSYRYPTAWHARTYGLFTANAFMDPEKETEAEAIAMKKGETITLRHRIVFHEGDAKTAGIKKQWKQYSGQ